MAIDLWEFGLGFYLKNKPEQKTSLERKIPLTIITVHNFSMLLRCHYCMYFVKNQQCGSYVWKEAEMVENKELIAVCMNHLLCGPFQKHVSYNLIRNLFIAI